MSTLKYLTSCLIQLISSTWLCRIFRIRRVGEHWLCNSNNLIYRYTSKLVLHYLSRYKFVKTILSCRLVVIYIYLSIYTFLKYIYIYKYRQTNISRMTDIVIKAVLQQLYQLLNIIYTYIYMYINTNICIYMYQLHTDN